jgi:hypothetical protein
MMRFNHVRALVCCAALGLSGCNTIKTEISSNGGLVGSIADRALPAPTKDMQLYRATLAFAIISRAGATSLRDPQEIKAFETYMYLVDDDLKILRKHIESGVDCNALKPDTYYCVQMFEAALPKFEEHILKLAAIGLPSDDFKNVIDDVRGGNFSSAAGSIIKMAGSTARAAHGGASVYRSSQEVMTLVAECSPPNAAPGVPSAFKCIHGTEKTKTFNDLKTKFAVGKVSGPYVTLYNVVQEACFDMQVRTAQPGKDNVLKYGIECRFAFGGDPRARYAPPAVEEKPA